MKNTARLRTRLPMFIQEVMESDPDGVLAYLVDAIDSLLNEDGYWRFNAGAKLEDLEERVRAIEVSKTAPVSSRGKSNE